MRVAYREGGNTPTVDIEAAAYLAEYNMRVRLKKLGYTDDINNLDCITAEAFCVIDAEIDKITEEKSKQKKR